MGIDGTVSSLDRGEHVVARRSGPAEKTTMCEAGTQADRGPARGLPRWLDDRDRGGAAASCTEPLATAGQGDRPLARLPGRVVSPSGPANAPLFRNGDITPQRRRGAFYTPDDLATALTRWALGSRIGTVLDPSYGGCSFLRGAVHVLRELRARRPADLVYGVDIDPNCVGHADGLVAPGNHLTADFLSLDPKVLTGSPFKAIVGNPPYVRHHWLKGAERTAARAVAAAAGIRLPATASTWAYFVIHALRFLAPEGRLAMLVPEAVLQADYAAPVRDALRRRFAHVLLIHVRDRIFHETEEPVVVIAAYGSGPGRVRIAAVNRAADLADVLEGDGVSSGEEVTSNGRLISKDALALLDELSSAELVSAFGDVATIRIGFVTGANHFFIRSVAEMKRLGLPASATLPVVARTQWLVGLEFTTGDHENLARLGRRVALVRPTERLEADEAVQAWIAQGTAEGVHLRHKSRARDPWFRVEPGPLPNAFATCSRLGSPLLVLNHAGHRCSNALHSVLWRDPQRITPEAVAVGYLTSLSALWAEIYGRRYGGGVLKLEPGTLGKMPIPALASGVDAFEECARLMREGMEDAARAHADDAVLRRGLGISSRDIARLRRAKLNLLRQRVPTRSGGPGA